MPDGSICPIIAEPEGPAFTFFIPYKNTHFIIEIKNENTYDKTSNGQRVAQEYDNR
jgi:hypothetical protein